MPPNPHFDRSAQRHRRWVPVALRAGRRPVNWNVGRLRGCHAGLAEMTTALRFLVALLLLVALPLGAKTLECEKYTVRESLKADRTIFVLTFDQDASLVRYRRVSGPEWFLPSGAVLSPVWISTDGLRVVATWVAPDYGANDERWSPVHLLDIDFGRPRYRLETFGGFVDFDTVVYSPWKQECQRLD